MDDHIKYKNVCINLARRPDRKHQMMQLFEANGITDYDFFPAVDGKEIRADDPDLALFENINSRRTGVIGCAMSHIRLWRKLLADPNYDYYVVFEDDAELIPNYKSKFENVSSKIDPGMDFIFIGYHTNEYPADDDTIHAFNNRYYGGGTFGYIINKNAAKKLLNYFKKRGIGQAIDYAILDANIVMHETHPHLVKSYAVQHAEHYVDSDIQRDTVDVPKYAREKKLIIAILILILIILILSIAFLV